ncbi:unnamed protein product [Fraxinus pennsylvanica]|uniref:Uncharacterized protein n=1 Tax=Fraxinus pennsylvanica TaxID=56036 RepID=A0AAD1ZXY7_9LAMI|nr:unnamed protein product [Fraxinus pennsylvanica]
MLPLKLVRSLIFPDTDTNYTNPLLLLPQNQFFSNHNNHHGNVDDTIPKSRAKTPLILFNPTQELVKDTYRLAKLAREIGMDLHPNPSLSHIIFLWPSCSWSLGNDAVPLPFPSLTTASMSHLRLFVNLSRGFFKLVFLKSNRSPLEKIESLNNNNWDWTSSCLFSRITGERIYSMDGFSKALLGMGWTLFKTNANNQAVQDSMDSSVYLYRKSGMNRICNAIKLPNANGDGGESCRVRELRLARSPLIESRSRSLATLNPTGLRLVGEEEDLIFLCCLDFNYHGY